MRSRRPGLVGRLQELDLLDQALADAADGRPRVVVVRGEAGIGKSRLVRAALARAVGRPGGATTAVGHCTPVLGSELPFGPVLELLRDLVATGVDLDDVAGPAAGPVLRTLLPRPGEPTGSPLEDVGLARSRLFASVLHLVGELGRAAPVVVVVEDVHWADASSLDLVTFLARTARRERLLVLLTVRDEAVHRGSATAARLHELTRAESVDELRLAGLPPAQVAELVAAAGGPAVGAARDRVVAASDGNPFLALELAGRDETEGVPPGLRDLLLSDVSAVPSEAREVLRGAALLGERIDHDVLAASLELPAEQLGTALRALVDAGLIEAGPGSYRFRHALVREVVVDDLNPAERLVGHQRVVRGLRALAAAGTGVADAELAHHLVAAGEPDAALPVALAAAAYADGVFAFAEARRQFAVARGLWPRVAEPERLAGLSYAALVCHEATAARRCDAAEEAVELLAGALLLAGAGERAALEQASGDALWAAGRTAESLEAYERAAGALSPGADLLRAHILGSRAKGLMLTGRFDEAAVQAREAEALARQAGARRDAVQARITLGVVEAHRGTPEAGLAELRACLDEARSLGDLEAVLRCYGNLTFVLLTHGRYEEAVVAAVEGERVCRQYGPLLAVAGTLVNNAVWALVALGRWTEAERKGRDVLSEWTPHGVGLLLHLTLAEVAVGRGDPGAVQEHLAALELSSTDDPYVVAAAGAVTAESRLWEGDAAAAGAAAERALARLEGQQDAHLHLTLSALLLRAMADLAGGLRGPAAGAGLQRLSAEVAAVLDAARRAADGSDLAPLRALLAQCSAEAARTTRSDTAEQWRDVAAEWQVLRRPHPQAYALLRSAGAELARHARAAALGPLRTAAALAGELGARPLAAAVLALATAGGLERDLGEPAAPALPVAGLPALRLTTREHQVLGLVVQGRTNRQIASTLFIAEKTASVHVSNILGKLGATNRVEAADVARRVGLLSD